MNNRQEKIRQEQYRMLYPAPKHTSLLWPTELSLIKEDFKNKLDRYWTYSKPDSIKEEVEKFTKKYIDRLSDEEIKEIVGIVNTCFKEKRQFNPMMIYMKFINEMAIANERYRPQMIDILPGFVSHMACQIENNKKYFFLKELKTMFRMWYTMFDVFTLRQIIQLTYIDAKIQIDELSHKDQLKNMSFTSKMPGFLMDKLFTTFINTQMEIREKEKIYHERKRLQKLADEENLRMRREKKKTEMELQAMCQKAQKAEIQTQVSQANNSDSKKQEEVQKVEQKNVEAEKAIQKTGNESMKLIQMYKKLMNEKKMKKGLKCLVSGGKWDHIPENLDQLTDVTEEFLSKVEAEWEEVNQDDQGWAYPFEERETKDPEQQLVEKKKGYCIFCSKKFETIKQDKDSETFKDSICFYVFTFSEAKLKPDIVSFKKTAGEKSILRDGVYLMHRSCLKVAISDKTLNSSEWVLS